MRGAGEGVALQKFAGLEPIPGPGHSVAPGPGGEIVARRRIAFSYPCLDEECAGVFAGDFLVGGSDAPWTFRGVPCDTCAATYSVEVAEAPPEDAPGQ